MKRKSFLIFALLGLFYLFGNLAILWQKNLPLLSPVDLVESLPPLAPIFRKPGGKVVFGFLPYWNMKDSDKLNIRSLTHLAYFGLDLNSDGTVRTLDNPREKEPGWRKLNGSEFAILSRQVKLLGKKLILTVVAMKTDQIETLLNDEGSRQKAISSILTVMLEKQFDGINVDFEYMGFPGSQTRDNFTRFVTDLTGRCKKMNSKCEISLDVFADSGVKNRLYDLSALGRVVDQVVVMAYDFFRPSSLQSGPVSPLRGKCPPAGSEPTAHSRFRTCEDCNCLDYDIVTSISDIDKLVPSYKVILGVPFYGYEWQTVDEKWMSRTYPKTGGLATYKRIQSLFSDNTVSSLSAAWSGETLTPFLSYSKDGNIYQIYYENEDSLKLKIDFIHQAKLSGLAIWALGYEIPYQNLWKTIANNL